MTPDSSFVTISDDEIDAPDCLTGPPVSSSEDCSEGVVDVGLVDGEFDAEDVEADDASDAEEAAVDPADASDAEEAAVDPADASDAEEDGDSSAQATPGEVAIAPPMPSATASAPTRPMYLEYIVGLELAEREPSESAVRRLAVGPARPLRGGDHAEAASDRAGKGSRTEGFECRFKDVAGFMTHPHGSPPTAVFAVTIASKADAMRGLP
jgi:hypothetical protein